MARELLFSVTKKDFVMQTFAAGGPGGQKQNTSNTGVRLIHKDSGAVGEARDSRSQDDNKKAAFRRLLQTSEWKVWYAGMVAHLSGKPSIEEQVKQAMQPHHLRVEGKVDGKWKELEDLAGLAQMEEHRSCKADAVGSNPTSGSMGLWR